MAVIDNAEPLQLIDLPEPTAATREALRFVPPPAGPPPAARRAAVLRTGAVRVRAGRPVGEAHAGPQGPERGGPDGWVLLRIRACSVCYSDLKTARRHLPYSAGHLPGR